jgi:hypothetical protein
MFSTINTVRDVPRSQYLCMTRRAIFESELSPNDVDCCTGNSDAELCGDFMTQIESRDGWFAEGSGFNTSNNVVFCLSLSTNLKRIGHDAGMMKPGDRAGDSRTASPELMGDLVVREMREMHSDEVGFNGCHHRMGRIEMN